jgi:hypothetical protein
MFKFTVGSCFYPLETESNEFILLLVSCSMICQVVLYILSDPAREQEKDSRTLFLLSLERKLLLVSCSMICQVVLYILSDPAREQQKDRRPGYSCCR